MNEEKTAVYDTTGNVLSPGQYGYEEALAKSKTDLGKAPSDKYRGKAKDAYERGLDAGLEHAMYCEMERNEYEQAWHDDTLGEILGEIVDGYRQYSPFEFTALGFNKARNSETLWEAYDKGEYDGWMQGLEKGFGRPSMD